MLILKNEIQKMYLILNIYFVLIKKFIEILKYLNSNSFYMTTWYGSFVPSSVKK